MKENTFSIYQLKDGDDTRDYRFEPYARLYSAGLTVDRENYNFIYTAPLADNDTPDVLFALFNRDRPADFTGHSLSISDVITLNRDGKNTAYYVDAVGFVELKGFLRPDDIEKSAPQVYKYYSTQRPVDIGTFPKTDSGPAKIVNFNDRENVEHGSFRAWGYLLYTAPLTQKQMDDYELRAAPGNPDRVRLEEQVQAVGQWEEKRKVPDNQRLTWWYPDFGSFVKKEFVTDEQLVGRYEKIMEGKTRAGQDKAEKKPISEQLKEATKQAQRGESPPEKKKPHSREDR